MAKRKAAKSRISGALSLIITLILTILQLASKNTPLVTIVLLSFALLAAQYSVCNTEWFTKAVVVAQKMGRFLFSLICLGATLGLLALWVWPYKVIVSPAKVTFKSVQHENYIFTVRNKTDDDLYSVQVKFTIDSKVTAEPFSIEIPLESRRPVIEGSNLADIRALKCHTSKEKPFLLFGIYRIGPHESREISFTHNQNSETTITADLVYFTESAESRLGERNRMQETFHLDEQARCDGDLIFFVDPNIPPPKSVTEERVVK